MLKLNINHQVHRVDADPNMPLLWVLRDLLKKKGTKFGCGMGLCGACTVLLDGKATRSCVTPVSSVQGKQITTIEGLSSDGNHPLQRAWKEKNVPQCGYCQPGQIMNAAGLLNENKTPSREQIRQAMLGNICRCGTYQRIEDAIKRASETMAKEPPARRAPAKPPAKQAAPTSQAAAPTSQAAAPTSQAAAPASRAAKPKAAASQPAQAPTSQPSKASKK